ncbi:hypothetical protein DPMN_089673 [Dreissena polymorpha]|uniref:Uncharacterized protein n=1 Tax=Dreissena polymorpha TaxID=45954 RepID=A0A9D4KXA8_DREPO|nr:hypothetical protein DPMN_089673 [Dreissena polymorpha]
MKGRSGVVDMVSAIGRSRVQSTQWEPYLDFPQRQQVLVLVPNDKTSSVSNKPNAFYEI